MNIPQPRRVTCRKSRSTASRSTMKAGLGRAACPHPLSGCLRTTPATPSRSADYAKHFTCISLDPRGAGETDKRREPIRPNCSPTTSRRLWLTIGVERAHVSGVSASAPRLGLWLAGKYPERVKSLSLHSCWTEKRSISQGGGRKAGKASPSPGQRPGNDHPRDIPALLHARALCGQARIHRPTRGFRAQQAEAAA